MNSYKELTVWQKSVELVIIIYKLTEQFPKSEIFGLTAQIKRSAISIPSNIAEGFARRSRLEYLHFIRIAFGSGAELETQIFIAKKLKFINETDYNQLGSLLTEIMKMLNKLISALKP